MIMDLDRSFGFLVHDVARLFGRRFNQRALLFLGLTRAQCKVLGYLARNEGINQAGLADLLEIKPMTLVRQIDRMEEDGWIERQPQPGDRRARRLVLTDKARPILARILDLSNEIRAESFAGLSKDEGKQLIELLRRVHAQSFGARAAAGGGLRRSRRDDRARAEWPCGTVACRRPSLTTSAENDATTIGALRGPLEGRSAVLARRRPLRQRLRLPLMLAGPILVLLAAGYWYLTGGRYVSTDDAYVQAARVAISTDISGRVVEIDVKDNQKVTAGQVLFRLDPRPFQIAVDEAKAQLATVRFQIHAMKATYHQKRADARATEATVGLSAARVRAAATPGRFRHGLPAAIRSGQADL